MCVCFGTRFNHINKVAFMDKIIYTIGIADVQNEHFTEEEVAGFLDVFKDSMKSLLSWSVRLTTSYKTLLHQKSLALLC